MRTPSAARPPATMAPTGDAASGCGCARQSASVCTVLPSPCSSARMPPRGSSRCSRSRRTIQASAARWKGKSDGTSSALGIGALGPSSGWSRPVGGALRAGRGGSASTATASSSSPAASSSSARSSGAAARATPRRRPRSRPRGCCLRHRCRHPRRRRCHRCRRRCAGAGPCDQQWTRHTGASQHVGVARGRWVLQYSARTVAPDGAALPS